MKGRDTLRETNVSQYSSSYVYLNVSTTGSRRNPELHSPLLQANPETPLFNLRLTQIMAVRRDPCAFVSKLTVN